MVRTSTPTGHGQWLLMDCHSLDHTTADNVCRYTRRIEILSKFHGGRPTVIVQRCSCRLELFIAMSTLVSDELLRAFYLDTCSMFGPLPFLINWCRWRTTGSKGLVLIRRRDTLLESAGLQSCCFAKLELIIATTQCYRRYKNMQVDRVGED